MLQRISFLFLTFLMCSDVRIVNTRSSNKRQHTNNVCTYELQTGVAIEFKESKARGAKLLDAVTKDDLDSCQDNCCQRRGCTLALFHSTNSTDNCYLIRCHPSDVCSFTDLEYFSISIVSSGDAEPGAGEKENPSVSKAPVESTTPTINYPPSSSLLNTTDGSTSTHLVSISISDETSSTPMVPTSIIDESPSVSVTDKAVDVTTKLQSEDQTQTEMPQVATTTLPLQDKTTRVTTELPAQLTTTKQRTDTDQTTETHPTTDMYVEVTELISETSNLHKVVNSTSNPILKSGVTYNKLSSNGALIASLCFGVLFACAVCVLLGKGWYEGYQRRHYTKVDYLINGMYN